MKKNMYSIMLSQKVVSQADRLAHAQGTNRSALINEILAQYFKIDTPLLQREAIFDATEAKIKKEAQPALRIESTESGFFLFGSLPFKYNPTVRYQLVLQWLDGVEVSSLRISSRTQNEEVKQQIESFFTLWQQWEQELLDIQDSHWNQNRFVRHLRLPSSEQTSYQMVGEAIADYVQILNDSLSNYFTQSTQALKDSYTKFLNSHEIIL